LLRHEVEFAVVGGVAAVLHGAPVTTFDLDALFQVSDGNARRLRSHWMNSRPATAGTSRRAPPTLEDVRAGRHLRLATEAGPLDMLGFVGAHEGYDDLSSDLVRIEVAGLPVLVLSLDAL